MDGKYILITGASSGIGREIAIQLSKGYNLVICGRSMDTLIETKELCSSDSQIKCFCLDLKNIDEIENTLSSFLQESGIRISHFVHSAGFMKMQPLKMLSFDNLRTTFDVNVFSATVISKLLMKKKLNSGALESIVFISSNISDRGGKALAVYGASKGALDSLMRCLSIELAPKVRVNSVLPGAVLTEMTKSIFSDKEVADRMEKTYPLGFGYPQDIANVVDFLISDKARWVTGQQFTVDGGRTIDISG